MEAMVLPKLPEGHGKTLTRDELPQSAAGKTIMTTEPKFIPKEAAEISLEDGINAKIRLIDCVGFMVEGAAGHEENGEERLVKTPWFDHEIPFTEMINYGPACSRPIPSQSTWPWIVTFELLSKNLEKSIKIDDFRVLEINF